MPGPSFICPGAQKSGTTWLHRQLNQHPQFWMPPQKEIDYLAEFPQSRKKYRERLPNVLARLAERKNAQRKIEWWRLFTSDWDLDNYQCLFKLAGKRFSGDVSPNYSGMTSEDVRRAGELVPSAKIVILLRDPVERAWSHARHTISRGAQKDLEGAGRLAAMERFATSRRCYNNGDYARILHDWRSAFGADKVHVAYYDDLQAHPAAFLNGILAFLEADPIPAEQEAELSRVINKGEEAPCPPALKQKLQEQYADMLDKLRPMLPESGRPDWIAAK